MKNKELLRFPFRENMKKVWRMARMTFYFWIGCLMTLAANSYSQVTKFNLNLEDRTIREAMDYIEENSEFIFLYKEQDLDVTKRVSLLFRNATIDKILDEMLADEEVQYSVYEKQIVIYKKPEIRGPLNSKEKFQLPAKEDSGTGSIQGHIRDENGLPMVGASIVIDKTTIGTITDANGNFILMGAPAGKQLVRISFVGYQEETREIVVKKGEVINFKLQMKESHLEITGVVAYGQARGQLSAIQQQINAKGISNVVSAEKLRELPDVNVAEAVGRLPGLMVERNRGEGQKIIIRGLEPKYNAISIGGNIVPSTSTDDRSTDLNMISPDILGGVEVQKANTADMDASGLGGTVNLTLKEAPSGLKINANILTGYSGFSNSLSNNRISFYISNRFFNDKLGIMLTGNAETAKRNSDRFIANYDVQGVPNYGAGETYVKPWITSTELQSNIEDRTRAGGSLLIDWKLSASSTIKSSNFIGYLNQHIFDRGKVYSLSSNRINLNQYQNVINQLLLSNSLEGKHFIFGSVLDWGASRSISINKKPYGHIFNFSMDGAFNGYTKGKSFDIGPPELVPKPENVSDILDQYYFANGGSRTYDAEEDEISAFLNWQTPFKLANTISGFVKAGTKFREKSRYRNNIRYNHPMDVTGYVDDFRQVYPDYSITKQGKVGMLQLVNFLDNNYVPGEYLNKNFEHLKIPHVIDRKLMSKLYDDFLKDYYFFIHSGAKDDYVTDESVLSYYLMSEINLGKIISFIPGIRYEKSYIKYKAYIAEEISLEERGELEVNFQDTIATNSYHHFLPQIHLRIKPTDWFDIRLAYTNTLSRPDYDQLAPKKIVNVSGQSVTMGNTQLKPALSRNYDVIFTFYKQKYGLLTLGAFYKDIEGFLWTRKALIVAGTPTDPDVLGVSRDNLGFSVTYPLNNPNRSGIRGFEIDLQSNMTFLPIKGFVFNLNFTLMNSETKYSETLIVRTLNPDYGVIPGAPRTIFLNQDTAYVDRLLKQPSYLANVGLGYDNRKIGLSVRLSFNYQDDILIKEQRRPDAADREGTLEFYRWDFQVSQRISKRLSFHANVANIFNQPDRSIRLISGYMRDIEYYGYLAQAGFKYDLF